MKEPPEISIDPSLRHGDRRGQALPYSGRALLSDAQWERVRKHLHLAPRELEIAKHIFDDDQEQAIAAALGLAAPTVHTYIQRLYQKLGVRSRVQLVIAIVSAAQMTSEKMTSQKRD